MKKLFGWLVIGACAFSPWMLSDAQAEMRLGVGANYWKSVSSIDDDDFDEDGLSWIGTAQFGLGDLLKLDLGVEWFEKGFAGSPEDVYAPQLFLILGSTIYAGVGAGYYYSDSEWSDDPFYAFRAGFNLELLPSVFVDINANYRFESWDGLSEDDINEDTITVGAALRFAL